MENDQLVKRVEWLDNERLSDKTTLSELEERIDTLENTLERATQHSKELSSEITRLNVIVEKVNKFEDTLSNYGSELKKELDAQEKNRNKREREVQKTHRLELDEISKIITEFRDGLTEIEKSKKELKALKNEDERLGKSIKDANDSIEIFQKSEEKKKRSAGAVSESQLKDAKRVADLQGEVSATRKRFDEFGGKMELVLSDQRKIETRLNEIQAAEVERRDAQNAFMEQITRNQEKRERLWKDWEQRFTGIEKQSKELAAHLKNISETERAVRKAQETFEDITGQLTRRINEITEMQRLGEEKFRQEFATFKADDQKRWTNYMLTQEELLRDSGRKLERLSGQTTNLEDTVQEMQDVLQHLSDQTEKRLQTMLANMSDWVAENERFLGSMR
ncbi:MAG: hypothetical protein IIC79_00540 [Chloroflexi bacterium]|nr:hypothetical protein [Chloroflexota bacterium]